MEASQFRRRRRAQSGFTMIEVLGAIFILSFGLIALAGFMCSMNVSTNESRYMQLAAFLASEKLEDLSRVPNSTPAMSNAGGSLTANASPATFGNQVVAYTDTVQVSTDDGAAKEVIVGTNSAGVDGYWTVSTTNAVASSVWASGSPPAPTPDMLTFNRRWLIEPNVPTNGVRRVTVLVTAIGMTGGAAARAASFQATMVRP